MKSSLVAIISAMLCLLFLPGCFGSEDINNLALVMAVGLDNGSKPGSIRITAQVARPSDVVGQTGAPTGGTGEPIWTATAEGQSIFEAVRHLNEFSSSRVYWAHNKVIVLNDDFARDHGINEVVDFFSRNHELRMRTLVVVTPNKASRLITSKTGLHVIPGDSIERLFRYNRIVADAPRVDMITVQADLLSNRNQVVLPKVELKNRGISSNKPEEFGSTPQVVLSGAAFFNKDKMAGWLPPEQTRALMWFINPPQSRIITVECANVPNESNGKASLELKSHRFDVKPVYQHGVVSFNVSLKANLDLVELGCPTGKRNPVVMRELEQKVTQSLTEEITNLVKIAQSEKIDFLQLAEQFDDKYPAEWKQLGKNWGDIFSEAKFHIQVHVHIHSPVLLRTPTMPDTTHSYQGGQTG